MFPRLACHRPAPTKPNHRTLVCDHPRTMRVLSLHRARRRATQDMERNVSQAVLPNSIQTQQPRAVNGRNLSTRMKTRPLERRHHLRASNARPPANTQQRATACLRWTANCCNLCVISALTHACLKSLLGHPVPRKRSSQEDTDALAEAFERHTARAS